MYWHYQVAYRSVGNVLEYGIIEVYKDKEGNILYISENFISPSGEEDPEEYDDLSGNEQVMEDLRRMMRDALKYEALNMDTVVFKEVE